MTAGAAGGLALGLASAGAIGGGFALQHRETARLPALSLRHPLRSLASLFGRRVWLAGSLLGLAGWAAYIVALRLAPLSLVQAAAAGGVVVLVFAGGRPSGAERAGAFAAVAGLVLLGLSLSGGSREGTAAPLTLALWLVVSTALAAVAAGSAARRLPSGVGLASAAGILYATADVATKEAVRGGAALVLVPVVLAASGLAFATLQLSFQRGGRLPTAGLATVWTNALPILAGTIVFGEPFPGGVAGVARAAAFLLVVAGGAALSRSGLRGGDDVDDDDLRGRGAARPERADGERVQARRDGRGIPRKGPRRGGRRRHDAAVDP